MQQQISILGSGWLGVPLATTLDHKGYKVNISTTTQEKLSSLKKMGLAPYLIKLSEREVEGDIVNFLSGSDILILNIPPGIRSNPNSNYVQKIKNLVIPLEQSTITHLIYISSTSVFEDKKHFPVITEKKRPDATKPAGKQLIEVENLVINLKSVATTLLRFGGLYDERRHPATMIAKKGIISNPDAPVNLIHRIDCVRIVMEIIQQKKYDMIFNAASPSHPSKKEYYQRICQEMGLRIPDADISNTSVGKIIDSSYLEKELNYIFTQSL